MFNILLFSNVEVKHSTELSTTKPSLGTFDNLISNDTVHSGSWNLKIICYKFVKFFLSTMGVSERFRRGSLVTWGLGISGRYQGLSRDCEGVSGKFRGNL